MLIGIDASRATIAQRTGTEGYSLQVIRGMITQGGAHQFRLYFRDEPAADLLPRQDNVEYVVIKRPRLWTHLGLGPAVKKDNPDVLFVPAHVLPWPDTGNVPCVVTIHDLGYMHYPNKHPVVDRWYLNWSTRHSANLARRIIAVSRATAHDLSALVKVPEDKIRVVYSGVDELLKPVRSGQQIGDLRVRLGIPGPYILHVGRLQQRKNLARLIEAFAQIQDTLADLSLVLAGKQDWGYHRLVNQIEELGLSGRVILPGYVPDSDLPTLYSGAAVYAFPSLYEGFGFPALEAMACGTPVVCSNTSSLPELVGDAALTVAPTDTKNLAESLGQLLTDEKLHQELSRAGSERVKTFTWEASARNTLDVLLDAARTSTMEN